MQTDKLNNKDLYILYVDDEKELLETLADNIEQLGFSALICNNTTEAHELIKKHSKQLALIISDFKMPDKNGLDFRKEMMSGYKEIPFIIYSGYITREDALKAVELKISAFIEKPCDFAEFKKIIETESKERITNIRDEEELIKGFTQDTVSLCAEIENLLLSLEDDATNPDTLNRIFAIAHTIKGSSSFFSPDTLHKFTHHYEDYLTPYKKSGSPLPKSALTNSLKAIDIIKTLNEELKSGNHKTNNLDELLLCFKAEEKTLESETLAASPSAAAQNVASLPKPPAAIAEEVRVPIKLLDEFMELSGEMTVLRNMIIKTIRGIERELTGNKNVSQLVELMDEIHTINSLMQDKIVDLRKVPLKNIFKPLNRTLRDLTISLKKDLCLETTGDELRVDTSIAEALNNSLIHLLRNAADHGVETTELRIQKNKPKKAKLKLHASQKGEEILITLSDDGKGIDPTVIKNKAIEKSLYTTDQLKTFSKSRILEIIFDSGFSTAAAITDVSGRGVGMDMVKRSVTKTGGKISIHSEINQGTQFNLTLPVPKSVTILSSLLIKAEQNTYAIPQDTIQRIVRINESERQNYIFSLEGTDLLKLDGKLFSIINLPAFLEKPTNQCSYKVPSEVTNIQIILVKTEAHEFGILVSEVLDIEDTVVKKLSDTFKSLGMFKGGTFLSDGLISLILDITGMAKFILKSNDIHLPALEAINSVEIKNAIDSKDFGILLFKLNSEDHYGVMLSDISRLEVMNANDIQLSGGQQVVLYQEKPMPIFYLEKLLDLSSIEIYKSQMLNVIVVQCRNQNSMGFIVRELSDLQLIPIKIDESIADRVQIRGNLVLDGKTITIINTDVIQNIANGIIQNTNPTLQDQNELAAA